MHTGELHAQCLPIDSCPLSTRLLSEAVCVLRGCVQRGCVQKEGVGCDCRYVVLNRPSAFVQWLQGTTIKEKYVFMSEPDHIWLKPMPNLMLGHRPAAFPFFYIEPSKADFLPITQKFTGPLTRKQAEQIAPIGLLNPPGCTALAICNCQA